MGSGKTAMIVREMFLTDESVYSNIITKNIKNNTVITKDDIFKTEVVSVKRDGTEVKKYSLNKEYWDDVRENNDNINVVIDEAHTLMNPRRSMSKKSVIMTDFMALLRRILDDADGNTGELILISQLERRLDIVARDMATLVQYCIGHYIKSCHKCGDIAAETNETPNQLKVCPHCGKRLYKKDIMVEVFSFSNMEEYHKWEYARRSKSWCKSYYERKVITDLETIFPYYNTLQWDNLLSD